MAQTQGSAVASSPDTSWPGLQNWVEWRDRCAWGLCEKTTQSRLLSFASHRFVRYLRIYSAHFSCLPSESSTPPAKEMWHRLEVYLVTGAGKGGKGYKKWVFARGGGQALEGVEAGMTLICRDAVRQYLREMRGSGRLLSLDAPVAAGSSLTWRDMLPAEEEESNPAHAAAEHERRAEGLRQARLFFDAAPLFLRVGWLARTLDLSLADAEVVRASGLSKSRLYEEMKSAVHALARQCSAAADGDREWALQLAHAALRELPELARVWAAAEKRMAPILDKAGARQDLRPPREMRE